MEIETWFIKVKTMNFCPNIFPRKELLITRKSQTFSLSQNLYLTLGVTESHVHDVSLESPVVQVPGDLLNVNIG